MIVRDEAAVLGDCLASIADEVDEIVIVDTGSTDATLDVAARHQARIFRTTWNQDFSAPRNIALDSALGDWILYIDADERLSVEKAGSLRAAVDDPDLVAVKLRLQPRNDFTAYHEYRLFRRDPRIRFRGRIHERVAPDIIAIADGEGLKVGECDAQLTHAGYDGDLAKKHDRNLPMLRLAVQEEPGRVYCWCHMGETLLALGDLSGAEEALSKAIRLSRASHHPQEVVEGSLAYEQLALLFVKQGRDPLPVIDEGLSAFSGNHALRIMRARALTHQGRDAEALTVLRQLTAIDADTFFDPRLAFNRRIFGEYSHELAGLAAFRLGLHSDAAAHYHRAFEASGNPAHLRKSQLAAARAEAAA